VQPLINEIELLWIYLPFPCGFGMQFDIAVIPIKEIDFVVYPRSPYILIEAKTTQKDGRAYG
jgi:hypothetical protein